jgi:nucleoside 2-deoxyribosyltransferase
MPTCFVIQPFDGGAFDKRYEDIFVPAIEAAGLEPYRVDRDPSATIPIDEIEAGIRKADACLADISLSNPNVWFELGYAIASAKPVVLVCVDAPDRRFPFDIQHRAVIVYRTESARDFDGLEKTDH